VAQALTLPAFGNWFNSPSAAWQAPPASVA
jgi:hypothetical protein